MNEMPMNMFGGYSEISIPHLEFALGYLNAAHHFAIDSDNSQMLSNCLTEFKHKD